MKNICGNCKFSKSVDGFMFECRRHAPILIVREKYTHTEYPTTLESDWCGEWKEKEQEDNEQRNSQLEHS